MWLVRVCVCVGRVGGWDCQWVCAWMCDDTQEVLHSYWVTRCVDLMPGAGTMIIAALKDQTPCVALCHTEFQRDLIMGRLLFTALQLMADPRSSPPYYPPHTHFVYDSLIGWCSFAA